MRRVRAWPSEKVDVEGSKWESVDVRISAVASTEDEAFS
jgi:hypothetical protein